MSRDNKYLNRRQVIKYGGIAGVGTVLAGCTGGGDGDGGDGDTGGDGGDGNGATPTETAEGDGSDGTADTDTKFVYSTTQKPSSIDPHKSLDELEGMLAHTIYDPLLYYSYEFPPKLVPGIATDWEISDDDKTYTFDIRDDATFHNGDPLTAEDVAFSVKRVMTIEQGPAWMWSGFLSPDGATAIDETTVEITLDNTFAPFLSTLPWMFVVNQNQIQSNQKDGDYGENGDFATEWIEDNDAGSGPYQLDGRERGSTITMTKTDDWWGEFTSGNVYEIIEAELTLEVSTIAGNMKNGTAHMTDRWLPTSVYEDIDASDNARVSITNTFMPYYIFMNTQRAPLDDVHVRRALSYAFDYQSAVNDVLAGSVKLSGPLPKGMKYHTTDGVTQYTRDLEKANAELEQSDYAPEEVEASYAYQPALTTNENVGLLMQNAFDPLGINFELVEMPWSKMVSESTNPDTAPMMFPLWNLVQYRDPDNLLYGMWHSSNVNTFLNGSKYQNDDIDSLLEQGRSELDEDTRAEIYADVQRKIAGDAAAIFVCNDATTYGLNQELQGFVDAGITGYVQQFQHYSKA